MNVSDIMTRDVASVAVGTHVRHAISIMLERGVSGLPVLDNDERLVGIVTEGDLISRKEIGSVLLDRQSHPMSDDREWEM